MATSSSNGGVPPGFRFHPTDEELLHYYLKKKIAYQKFDMEVIREVDLNKMEPWELQERCKIGSTPQNEWYFFSHKDRKYPTGSRTNRATNAGFWKATGRDKCIRNTYKKIGMRKTLVFYRGRAPHGQKTDWIMHEYRLEDGDDPEASEDGWVVCRVFKKKNLFKVTTNEGGTSSSMNSSDQNLNTSTTIQPRSYTQYHNLLRHGHQTTTNHELNKPTDLALHPYSHHIPTPQYSLFQSQPLLPSPHYSSMPSESSVMVKQLMTNPRDCESGSESLRQYQCGPGMEASTTVVDTTTSHQMVSGARTDDDGMSEWAMLTSHQDANAAPVSHQMNQQLSLRGEMDFWGYGGK